MSEFRLAPEAEAELDGIWIHVAREWTRGYGHTQSQRQSWYRSLPVAARLPLVGYR
jgi:hypothetical protein